MGHSVFSVTILGANSALPAYGRQPTSQLLTCDQSTYLIDCGEGTQIQLRKYGIKFQRIKAIFISHLHGDHYYGLLGLLNSMSLLGRQKRLTLVAPSALEEIIELQQSAGKSRLDFEIDFISTDRMRPEAAEIVYSDKQIEVSAFGLKHRIACCGYLFRQRKKPKTYLPERGLKYAVPVSAIASIKAGEDYIRENGEVVKNSELTKAPIDPSSYAFCTDTLPLETTIRHVQGVECLYHEATFLQRESDRARKTFHTTAIQAAEIARLARVKMLVIGHFSARYEDLTPLKEEAESAFYTVELAEQGRTFLISS